MLRGEAYTIVRLYELFGRQDAITDIQDGILVLADAGDKSACLLADTIVGKFQVVVKPLPTFLSRFGIKRSGISGCTIMGNGNISLIVNVQDLVE
jgi:two-component system chemotaxis sensor kinase CheA